MGEWNDIRSLTLEELTDAVLQTGEKKFRAGQIYGWLHKKLVRKPEEMTNVPRKCLEKLVHEYPFYGVTELERYTSKLDGYKIKLKAYSHKDQKPYWTSK